MKKYGAARYLGSAIYGSFSLFTEKKTSLSLKMKGKNFALDQ